MDNYNCKNCTEKFDDEYSLQIHFLNKHANTKCICKICKKEVISIVHHLKNNHSEEYENCKDLKILYELSEYLKCSCGFKSYKQTLLNHIKNFHINEKI